MTEDADERDDGSVRAWLVERDYDDKGLVTTVYATGDGARQVTRETAWNRAGGGGVGGQSITAAIDVEPGRLTPVEDDDRRERYAAEAERMADRHDPDDPV